MGLSGARMHALMVCVRVAVEGAMWGAAAPPCSPPLPSPPLTAVQHSCGRHLPPPRSARRERERESLGLAPAILCYVAPPTETRALPAERRRRLTCLHAH